jgi:hypothetical protein
LKEKFTVNKQQVEEGIVIWHEKFVTGSTFKIDKKWHNKFFNRKGQLTEDQIKYKKQIVQVYFNWIMLVGCSLFIARIIKNKTQKLM